jgi:hypothetical protein
MALVRRLWVMLATSSSSSSFMGRVRRPNCGESGLGELVVGIFSGADIMEGVDMALEDG